MVQSVASWIGTVVFLITFGVMMVAYDPLVRIACFLHRRWGDYMGGVLQVSIVHILWLCGARIEVERSNQVMPHTSYIIISNHQSMFDIPLFGWQLFSNFPKYISKVELAKWLPSVSAYLRYGHHGLIDRSDRDGALTAIRQLADEVVQHGNSAVIFPEGTRARKGRPAPFKPSGTLALLERAPDTPVLPVCLDNSWKILRHSMLPIPWGIRLRMWIGDPIERTAGQSPQEILAAAQEQILGKLSEFRGEPVLPHSESESRPDSHEGTSIP